MSTELLVVSTITAYHLPPENVAKWLRAECVPNHPANHLIDRVSWTVNERTQMIHCDIVLKNDHIITGMSRPIDPADYVLQTGLAASFRNARDEFYKYAAFLAKETNNPRYLKDLPKNAE